MKLIKTSPTAPIQAVTETTLESNSNINAPTIKAVVDNLYRPNLLINGDFQINQRGQKVYESKTAWTYTADMWRIKNKNGTGLTLTINEDGTITIANANTIERGYLQQWLGNTLIGTHTLCCYVTSITGICFMGNNDEKVLNVGENHLSVNYSDGLTNFLISIMPNSSVTLKYVDLFEEPIAYPHIKEDYATALGKCTRYLQYIHGCVPTTYAYTNCFYLFNTGYSPMAHIPSITSFDCWSYNSSGENINYKSYNSLAINKIRIQLRAEFTESLTVMACIYDITLSCEPL